MKNGVEPCKAGLSRLTAEQGDAVKNFLAQQADDVIGVLSGFDRLIFRGTIRQLAHLDGMHCSLAVRRVLLKDFGQHARAMSEQLKAALVGAVEQQRRPVIYLASSQTDKEATARAIAERDGLTTGPICLLTAVEPCQSFDIYRDRARRQIELTVRRRKCLFLYLYLLHPVLGFMHARIQSWFPFNIQVGLNGREWLSRQLDRARLDYDRRANCLAWVADVGRAQRLFAQQLRTDWPRLLNRIARTLNPAHPRMFGAFVAPYYWSVYQSEWATDVLFRDAARLRALYPRLIDHAIRAFSCTDVLRFLGHKVPAHGQVHGHFTGEVRSDLKRRPEGMRLKHWVHGNSIKVYDKQGSVLRIETTINTPRGFTVFRPTEGDRSGRCAWRPMRQGIADLHRRTVVSQAANDRYAEALATVRDTTPLGALLHDLTRPVTHRGRRLRALRPWAPDDLALLRAINRGEFTINGVRNADLRTLLYPGSRPDPRERRRRAARVTRQLTLLRAHGILRKVPHTHRYQLTPRGRRIITALLAAHSANTDALSQLAA
jgi:hypothetical protein